MHRPMIFGIIFIMISLDIVMVRSCWGGGGRQSRKKTSKDYDTAPPTQWPSYSSSQRFSSFPNEAQSVEVPKKTYEEVCVHNAGEIPDTRETKKKTENGKQVSKAIDGNIAVCAKQTQLMDHMDDRYDMRRIVMPNGNIISLFALYDGHGNANVAECAANNLLYTIEKEILNQRGQPDYKEILVSEIKNFDKKLKDVYDWESLPPTETSFSEAIERMKKNIQTKENEKKDIKYIVGGGSTALIGLIDKQTLYVANLGDTHGEMCCNFDKSPISLSDDFDVANITGNERSRIEKAGGQIEGDYVRLKKSGEGVSVVRGLGDYELKPNYENPIVSYEAEVRVVNLRDYDSKYILFATDGAWPRLNKKEVDAQKAFEQIGEDYTNPNVYYGSLNLCNYMENNMHNGNKDNVTVMVVNLK